MGCVAARRLIVSSRREILAAQVRAMPREAFWLSPYDRIKVYVSIAALVGCLILTIAAFAVFVAFAWPTRDIGNPAARLYVGAESKFEVGVPVQFPKGQFWLVKQADGSFVALYWHATMTYRGCTVSWRESFVFQDPRDGVSKAGWFRDPCSGSTWDVNGVRVFGPATRNLDRFPVEVANGSVYVLASPGRLIRGDRP
jgi:hypothetical protein